jgi:hypothetical protein
VAVKLLLARGRDLQVFVVGILQVPIPPANAGMACARGSKEAKEWGGEGKGMGRRPTSTQRPWYWCRQGGARRGEGTHPGPSASQ